MAMTRDEACAEMYAAGATLEEIGKAFGFAHTTARNILLKHGVQMRIPGRRRMDYAEAQRLLDGGMNQTAVARAMGVRPSSVCQAIKRGMLRQVRA